MDRRASDAMVELVYLKANGDDSEGIGREDDLYLLVLLCSVINQINVQCCFCKACNDDALMIGRVGCHRHGVVQL